MINSIMRTEGEFECTIIKASSSPTRPRRRCTIIRLVAGCTQCDKAYTDQTMQGIPKRVTQHKQACRRFDRLSAISNHQETMQHRIDFEGTEFIEKEPNLVGRRLVLEASHTSLRPME
ncbi:hypothetical protein ACOME3_006802 [Neoechinorhynchus agilis]